MIDPASKTTMADRKENYWNKKRLEMRVEAAKLIALHEYKTSDITSLSPKQIAKILTTANRRPKVTLKKYKTKEK